MKTHIVMPRKNIMDKSQANIELLQACESGRLEAVQQALLSGADVNEASKYGRTALMRAACECHSAIVRMLIDAGANVDAVDERGWAALMWAACNGHIDVARSLIDAGANVDAASKSGWTALMLAGGDGHIDIVRLLLENGADPHVKNNYGQTAADVADVFGYTDCAKFIRAWANRFIEQQESECMTLEQADDHAHICSKLAEQYKNDPVLFAALTDAAAIIRDLVRGVLARKSSNEAQD